MCTHFFTEFSCFFQKIILFTYILILSFTQSNKFFPAISAIKILLYIMNKFNNKLFPDWRQKISPFWKWKWKPSVVEKYLVIFWKMMKFKHIYITSSMNVYYFDSESHVRFSDRFINAAKLSRHQFSTPADII